MKIGAFEAKSQFSSLLERAAHGEEIIITKHGKPVARLVATNGDDEMTVEDVFGTLKSLRKQTTLNGIPWKELRDEGRK
ncbi:type II toxin-antitoxin system Phd/YefM family antitoxin [Rhizobium tubonense]|uniref:Antitoxin n=1 Tax=Rhizobium tubonense TaxID=484088 RepID=A0A2W4EIS3_9HYPH|nr:type II toxin-antitoxin system prevent-host-death family antitoxin [Rhizobium tubonense]PZM13906.1 type II toxin-antitoxin system prevent-host-death family antitoxin [Rhizobium tubonense]